MGVEENIFGATGRAKDLYFGVEVIFWQNHNRLNP